jgi:hypothetical protein
VFHFQYMNKRYDKCCALSETSRQLNTEAKFCLFKNATFILDIPYDPTPSIPMAFNPASTLQNRGIASDYVDAITKISMEHDWFVVSHDMNEMAEISLPSTLFKGLKSLQLSVCMPVPSTKLCRDKGIATCGHVGGGFQ